MKEFKQIFATLIAGFLLALVIVPCSDNCYAQIHTTPTNFQQAQDYHQQCKDLCSPFCVCACCATTITVNHFSTLQVMFSPTSNKVADFYQSFFSEFHYSIWQPPKIS